MPPALGAGDILAHYRVVFTLGKGGTQSSDVVLIKARPR
jgi:hypothetical protein